MAIKSAVYNGFTALIWPLKSNGVPRNVGGADGDNDGRTLLLLERCMEKRLIEQNENPKMIYGSKGKCSNSSSLNTLLQRA